MIAGDTAGATLYTQSPAFHAYTGLMTLDALLNSAWWVFADAARHLVLPVVTLTYFLAATLVRITRASMLEVLEQAGRDPYLIPTAGFDIDPHPPSTGHPFGTTENQFDLYYGMVWGARTVFKVTIGVIGASILVGVAAGLPGRVRRPGR